MGNTETKTLLMELSISRIYSNQDEGAVRIQFKDLASGAILVNGYVPLEDFAKALLGQSAIQCEVEVYSGAPIGK